MYENKFSPWRPWPRRDEALGVEYPGVYALAYSTRNIAGKPFSWRKDIIYVGMTNSVSGLRGRLKQFDNTIVGKTGHGGADRVRYKYRNYGNLVRRLYVSVAPRVQGQIQISANISDYWDPTPRVFIFITPFLALPVIYFGHVAYMELTKGNGFHELDSYLSAKCK